MPRSHLEPRPILLSGGRFRDFDQFREATRGWNLDFRQLDRGELDAQLLQMGLGPVVLMHASFNRRFDQRGGAPSGLRTFALPEERSGDIDWCGYTVSGGNLNAFSRGGEFHAVSPPRFEVHTVSVAEEVLDEVARTLGLAHFPDRERPVPVLLDVGHRTPQGGGSSPEGRLAERATGRGQGFQQLRRDLEPELVLEGARLQTGRVLRHRLAHAPQRAPVLRHRPGIAPRRPGRPVQERLGHGQAQRPCDLVENLLRDGHRVHLEPRG